MFTVIRPSDLLQSDYFRPLRLSTLKFLDLALDIWAFKHFPFQRFSPVLFVCKTVPYTPVWL